LSPGGGASVSEFLLAGVSVALSASRFEVLTDESSLSVDVELL
jgi:hypothetical protein